MKKKNENPITLKIKYSTDELSLGYIFHVREDYNKVLRFTYNRLVDNPKYSTKELTAFQSKLNNIDSCYEVYMVRTKNNVNISNKKRALLANKSGADIYIRIHGDSSGSRGVKGASIFYPSAKNRYVSRLSRASKRLSQKLINSYCKKTGIKKRGCSGRDDLTGTNWSKIPVTLIECGFLSNPSEDRKLQNKSFQKKMAVGMANGVNAYFGY